MQRRYPKLLKKLRLRVKALQAAESLGDLNEIDPAGRWHWLHGDRQGCYAGDLSGNWRIIVEPNPQGSLAAVEVTVIEIADYH